MKLIGVSLIFGQALSYQIVNDARSQIEFLRVRRKNSGFFEEAGDDNFDRECVEEMCSYEELSEIHKDENEAKKAWDTLTRQCYVNQCNAQGTKLCVQTWNKRVCKCKDGWSEGQEGTCNEDIDECNGTNNCSAEQVCINTDGSYNCQCRNGFQDNDGSCVDIDECSDGTAQCGANSNCENTQGGYNCNCVDGFAEDESGQCTDIDECEDTSICAHVPNSSCQNKSPGFDCVCQDGYERVGGDQDACVDINECDNGAECGNGICQNNDGGYTCLCSIGYENSGDSKTGICVDTNECLEQPCLPGQSCYNTKGDHVCCDANQDFDSNSQTCKNKDPCEGIVCGENASCVDGNCKCDAGFHRKPSDDQFIPLADEEFSSGENRSDSQFEEEISPCTPYCQGNPCGEGFDCINGENHFSCKDHCITQNVTCIGGTCTKGVCNCPEAHNLVGGVCVPEPTQVNFAPSAETPMLAPTGASTPSCPAGFSWDGASCADVDECQINNGGCSSMCMNYWGTKRCYNTLSEEQSMCHHYSEKSLGGFGYECKCFKNYHLCNDGFSCVTNDGYNKYNRRGVFDYEKVTTCPAGQFGIDGSCFSISSEKATYQGAIQACKENGGALVNLQDRKVWWVIGNKVQYGDEPYWVSNKCNTKLMWIVGEKTGALLANPAGNMDNVPPQLNYVSPSESHHYACQH